MTVEKMLQKIASQLAAVDEASLTQLWDKYQKRVQEFEPTRRWEEAVLVLSMIQAVRWKNQLFNTKWAKEKHPAPAQEQKDSEQELSGPVQGPVCKERGKLIRFRPRED
ncbi:MAG: hypothetical protein ACQEQX_00575 [Thermodesulfobacteriota bacterium]